MLAILIYICAVWMIGKGALMLYGKYVPVTARTAIEDEMTNGHGAGKTGLSTSYGVWTLRFMRPARCLRSVRCWGFCGS